MVILRTVILSWTVHTEIISNHVILLPSTPMSQYKFRIIQLSSKLSHQYLTVWFFPIYLFMTLKLSHENLRSKIEQKLNIT